MQGTDKFTDLGKPNFLFPSRKLSECMEAEVILQVFLIYFLTELAWDSN